MEAKQLKFMKGRAKVAIAALLVVTSIAAGSAVLAQDLTTKPATPQATEKMGMDAGRDGMMGMGADGNGMKGMMSGMQKNEVLWPGDGPFRSWREREAGGEEVAGAGRNISPLRA